MDGEVSGIMSSAQNGMKYFTINREAYLLEAATKLSRQLANSAWRLDSLSRMDSAHKN